MSKTLVQTTLEQGIVCNKIRVKIKYTMGKTLVQSLTVYRSSPNPNLYFKIMRTEKGGLCLW